MRKIMLLAMLLVLAGCWYIGKELTFADTLSIPLSVFPSGWNIVSTQHEPQWRSQNVFLTQYSQQGSFLNLIYWFVYYDTIEASSEFSERFLSSDNLQDSQPTHLSDTIALTTQNYDEYDLQCRDIVKNGNSLQQCTAHLRYSHCNIVLSSNIDDANMTLPDFVNLLNYVDQYLRQNNI